jgi:hypothetical protein
VQQQWDETLTAVSERGWAEPSASTKTRAFNMPPIKEQSRNGILPELKWSEVALGAPCGIMATALPELP